MQNLGRDLTHDLQHKSQRLRLRISRVHQIGRQLEVRRVRVPMQPLCSERMLDQA
ncbi:hypothetical protein D9M70_571860 [compost metagenome]